MVTLWLTRRVAGGIGETGEPVPCVEFLLAGFAIHYYHATYLSGEVVGS